MLHFLKVYPQNLKCNVKEGVFSFDFRWHFHTSRYFPLTTGGGGDGVLLIGQNPLSMAKIICQQSLTYLDGSVGIFSHPLYLL